MNSIQSFRIILIFLCSCATTQVIAQVVFEPDANGYVSDVRFHALIKQRGYHLVGSFEAIEPNSTEKYAKFQRFNKWGYINLEGEEVVHPRYLVLGDFSNGATIAAFEIEDTVKFISYYERERPIWSYNKKMVFGLIDRNDSIITTREYSGINRFQLGKGIVQLGVKQGIIDETGKEVIPCIFDRVQIYADYSVVSNDGKWGVMNFDGDILTPLEYDKIAQFQGFLLAYKADKFIVLNPETGKPFVQNWFDDVNNRDRNEIWFRTPQTFNALALEQVDAVYLINQKGEIISAPYDDIRRESEDYYCVWKNGRVGIINAKGKLIIEPNYDLVGSMGDEPVFWTKTGEVISHLKSNNKPFPSSKYSEIRNFNNGVAMVQLNSKYGFINSAGKLVIPAIYDNHNSDYGYKNEILMRKERKWGVMNLKGEPIIPFMYDGIRREGDKYMVTNHKYLSESGSQYQSNVGLINKQNEVLIPISYQSVSLNRRDTNYTVQLDGKWGVVDSANNIIVPIIYDKIGGSDYFVEGLLSVKNGELYGMVNKKGEIVFPVMYEFISDFEKGLARCNYDDKYLRIDRYGNEQKQ